MLIALCCLGHRLSTGRFRDLCWRRMGYSGFHSDWRLFCPPMEYSTQRYARSYLCSCFQVLGEQPTALTVFQRMYIFSICYSGSLGFAKAAILLEWNRIFVPQGMRNRFFWSASILLLINTLLYISVVVAVICSCTPPQKLWNPLMSSGECLNRQTLDTTAAAFNLVTDFAIFLLPQHKIWSLQMTTTRKAGVSVVFSFGLLCVNIYPPQASLVTPC